MNPKEQLEYDNWIKSLSPKALTFINEYPEVHEILIDLLTQFKCNCDYDSDTGATICVGHKAERVLNELGL